MWMRERCLPFRTWINVGVSTNVYVQVSILPIYLRACLQLKMKFWLVCPMDEWNAEIVNRTEVYRFSIHRPQSRRWYEPCCYLYIILLHSSKFCSHVPFTTGNTSILAYMDDDVESIQVRLGHIHIYSANLAMMMVRRWRRKKSPSPKHKKYFDELLRYDYVYDWWWMQMSYRTEAYRISITSSRNSADRNVAVALTCTLLCYWRKSFTIDSSH